MRYLSRRRGVISVFLLIIYVITYVFMGALVDAGRYRIAQTYAEAALENASTSVLANYNKLVYDLYGLFSVDLGTTSDAELTAKIKSSYEQYLNESLGLASVKKDDYVTKLNSLIDAVVDDFTKGDTAEGDKATLSIETSALYDFQITEMNVGTTITLADTANVENQIIEHMKYRAPLELVQEMKGFLNGLNELVGMGKQIGAISEKMKITSKSEYTSLPQAASAIPGEVSAFAEEVKSFANTYDESWLISMPDLYDRKVGYNPAKVLEYKECYKNIYLTAYAEADVYCSASNRATLNQAIYDALKMPEDGEDEEVIAANKKSNENLWTEILEYETNALLEDFAYDLMSSSSSVKSVVSSIESDRRVKRDEAKRIYEDSLTWSPGDVNTSSYAYKAMETKASELAAKGQTLLDKVSKIISDYEKYIAELEALEKKNEGDATISGVCDADVQIAKSSAGSMLEHVNYLNKVIQVLKNIHNDNALSDLIYGLENEVAQHEIQNFKDYGNAGIESYTLYKLVRQDNKGLSNDKLLAYAELSKILVDESTEAVEEVTEESKTDSGEDKNTKAEDISKTKPNTSEMEPEGEVEKGSKKIDTTFITEHPELLDVKFMSTTSNLEGVANMDVSLQVEDDEMNAAWVTKLLEMGTTIVDGISAILNDVRDNLYINCYIMDMFPNYYMHYANADSNKNDKLLSESRSKYNASLAEVEFIITGAGLSEEDFYKSLAEEEEKGAFAKFFDWLLGKEGEKKEIDGIGELSVKEFRNKLFGTRMLFNTISMFLDTSKYTQATTISAWAGPFAPVVAIVLMVAWAIAETVIDVKVLMGEKPTGIKIDYVTNSDGVQVAKVPLLKLSAEQWFLSLEGVISGLVGTAIDGVVDGIISTADTLKTSMLNKADEAMFDIYQKAKTATKSEIEDASKWCQQATEESLGTWMEEMTSSVTDMSGASAAEKQYAKDLTSGVNTAVNSGISEAQKYAQDLADKGIDATYNGVSGKVMETLTTVGDKVTDSIESTVTKTGETVKKALNDKIDKVLPEMVGTGKSKGCEFSMGYTDYLMFFLLTMDGDVKIKRVMALIQANITNGMNADYQSGGEVAQEFLLENCPVSIWADLELSMKYMFMSDQLVPESMRRNGRMRLKVISAQSY